jgi:RNA polymerase sigma-70 factor (ECF subfamily)
MEQTERLFGSWLERLAATGSATLDEALIARCLNGDEAAFDLIYQRYAAYIYRLVYGLLQQRQDAEEVLQDSFEYAFRRLARFDARRASFKTWLYKIAVSRSRNKRRRPWLPTLSLSLLPDEQLGDGSRPQPEEQLALDQRQRVIWEALQSLSPKLRETAVLRYYEELSYVEIGLILDIPAKTAQSRMRLAHKQLRALIDKEGL